MNGTIQKLFLELLCAAIWDRPVKSNMFENLDAKTWKALFSAAHQQTTGALIADKVLSLPPQSLPPTNQAGASMVLINKTAETNNKLVDLLLEIEKEYHSQNISLVLLKGWANALNYPNPLLRTAGDLDLFLYRQGDFDKANQWVKEQQLVYHIDDFRTGHIAFEMNGFIVENHKYLTFFEINKYNKILQSHLDCVIKSEGFETVDVQGKKIHVLPAELNAFYIFLHFFFHFIHSGVSFRQYCDWILFLYKHHQEINNESFTKLAQSFDLLYPMQLFAQTAIEFLETPRQIFPFDLTENKKYPKKIMDEIFAGGSFGFYHLDLNDKNLWRGRWNKYKTTWKKVLNFGGMAPRYILIIPFVSLFNRTRQVLKGN